MTSIADWFHALVFASDATRLALMGLGCWTVAGLCLFAERRRNRRRDLDRVGFMPWTTLFVLASVVGGGLLALSLPVVIAG